MSEGLNSRGPVNRHWWCFGVLSYMESFLEGFVAVIFKASTPPLWEETQAVWFIGLFGLFQTLSKLEKWMWWPPEMPLGVSPRKKKKCIASRQIHSKKISIINTHIFYTRCFLLFYMRKVRLLANLIFSWHKTFYFAGMHALDSYTLQWEITNYILSILKK